MLGILKSLAVAVIVATAATPGLARDARLSTTFSDVGRFYAASTQRDGRRFEDVRATSAASLNIAQLNRMLWESSFEREILRGSMSQLTPAAISFSANAASRTGAQRVSHGGMLIDFVPPFFIENSLSGGLSRRPGIGACLLAVLAITALAISRRRTGYQPIVPPRPFLEARVASDGEK